jgi:hypothetical protein
VGDAVLGVALCDIVASVVKSCPSARCCQLGGAQWRPERLVEELRLCGRMAATGSLPPFLLEGSKVSFKT